VLNKILERYNKLSAILHYRYFQIIKQKRYTKKNEFSFDPFFDLDSFLQSINIPQKKIIYLHVSLKELKYLTKKSYELLTEEIIDKLQEIFHPSAIVVPTFTPSFIKSGIYSLKYSRSEVGIFSEIFRSFADYRTMNPIHNFSIISDNLFPFDSLDYTDTYSKNGFYAYTMNMDSYTININTQYTVASILHYIENKFTNKYRLKKEYYYGKILNEADEPFEVNVRHQMNNRKYLWNREKIDRILIREGVLVKKKYRNIGISVFNNCQLCNILGLKIQKNKFYLVTL